jgi:hypothetical protein
VESTSTSPRSQYLERLFSERGVRGDFGHLVTPLGVQYVVLAKTADWKAYEWLNNQGDLKRLMNTSTLEVWSNRVYDGVGDSVTGREIRQTSPVSYEIGPGRPGWIVLDAPYQRGWSLDQKPVVRTPQGTVAFYVGRSGAASATFEPWAIARLGYWVSAAAFVIFSALVAIRCTRRVRKGESASAQQASCV